NAVDPLDIIEVFGTDALRYGIISITAEGQDVYASKEKFEVGRNFANKIWNASRFVLMNLDIKSLPKTAPKRADLNDVDRWILSRLNHTIEHVTECLERSRFNEAVSTLYDFFWHQFCDWYLEFAKPNIKTKETQWVVSHVLENSLKLLHPFMPFLTEEIWQKIPHKGESIMISDWPKADARLVDRKIEAAVELITSEIQSIRNVRSAWQINPKDPVLVAVKVARDKELKVLKDFSSYIVQMAKVSSLQIGKNITRPKESAVANIGRIETYVVLSGLIDIQVERQRIECALEDVEKMIRGVEGRLRNDEFVKKAPKDIVDRERLKAEELENRKKRLQDNLRTLSE
ncbi:MAG TPA: class I tRNA ligase family protein, partial [Candidatus Omnitrophota bacterium]|nr:class I tRNA ligase family protein [Candidatus Omnitrophota bacterium]